MIINKKEKLRVLKVDGKIILVTDKVCKIYYGTESWEYYHLYKKKQGKIIQDDENIIFQSAQEVSLESIKGTNLISSYNCSAEEEYFNIEKIKNLRLALNILTEEENFIIDYIFFKNCSKREVARRLGICNKTLLEKEARILKKLKKYLLVQNI